MLEKYKTKFSNCTFPSSSFTVLPCLCNYSSPSKQFWSSLNKEWRKENSDFRLFLFFLVHLFSLSTKPILSPLFKILLHGKKTTIFTILMLWWLSTLEFVSTLSSLVIHLHFKQNIIEKWDSWSTHMPLWHYMAICIWAYVNFTRSIFNSCPDGLSPLCLEVRTTLNICFFLHAI